MEVLWVTSRFPGPDLKLRKEILTKLPRDSVVLTQDRIQVPLDVPVESRFHGAEAQPRVRQM